MTGRDTTFTTASGEPTRRVSRPSIDKIVDKVIDKESA
jgi:hypothetical protein